MVVEILDLTWLLDYRSVVISNGSVIHSDVVLTAFD